LQLYSRYLFTKTVATFTGIISILICLIWFSRSISLVKYVTENGIQISQFLYLFLLILPWLLLFIVPISLFAAILITYNRMLTNNEITILKNSGLTKAQICFPIIGFSILCSIFCFLNSFYLMPYSNQQMRLLRYDFKNNYTSLAFSPQSFETLNNLTIYARDRDKNNNLLGILLNDERSKEYSVTITATKGNIIIKDSSALLYMEYGTVQKFNRLNNKSEILNFDDYVFNLTEDKTNNKVPSWNAKERFFFDLLNPEPSANYVLLEKLRAELHERITFPLFPIILSLIALSAILHGQFNRKGNMRNILIAGFGATLFLTSTLTTYDLIASSAACIPLLYLNLALFIAVCLKFLSAKKS
jgi:lipopolysaccharide export system permease protein